MSLSKLIPSVERGLVIATDATLAVAALPSVHALNPRYAAVVIGAQHVALLVQSALAKPAVQAITQSADPVQQLLHDLDAGTSAVQPESAATPDVPQV